MKKIPFLVALLGLALAGAGCGHLDITPETDPQRTVSGVVTMIPDLLFPPGTIAVIRVIDTSTPERAPIAAGSDIVAPDRTAHIPVERVLGEQTVRSPGAKPVAFKVEFRADDATMRHGLNIDARISWEGKVQYRTVSAHVITLASVNRPQEVWVEAVR